MMKKLSFLALSVIAISPLSARHEPMEYFEWYGKVYGGANFINKGDGSVQYNFKKGPSGGLAVGYRFCNHLEWEVEGTYRRNEVRDTFVDGVDIGVHGPFQSWSFMTNFLREFGPCWTLKPYIGGGFGYTLHDKDLYTLSGTNESNRNGFAYQFMAGINYPFFCCEDKITFGVEYRYHHAQLGLVYQDLYFVFRNFL